MSDWLGVYAEDDDGDWELAMALGRCALGDEADEWAARAAAAIRADGGEVVVLEADSPAALPEYVARGDRRLRTCPGR